MTDLVLGAITGRESGVVTDVQQLKYQLATAWVNFDGTGTVAIRDSYNVSSITDNAVGDYTVNFSTAMDTASYTMSGLCNNAGAGAYIDLGLAIATTVSGFRLRSVQPANTPIDSEQIAVSTFGGLN